MVRAQPQMLNHPLSNDIIFWESVVVWNWLFYEVQSHLGASLLLLNFLRLKLSVYFLCFLNIWQFFFFSLEEDTYSSYARQLSKYFLAEGVISGHSIFLASAEPEPNDILKVINISVFHNLG